jgi:hypothetical protein
VQEFAVPAGVKVLILLALLVRKYKY